MRRETHIMYSATGSKKIKYGSAQLFSSLPNKNCCIFCGVMYVGDRAGVY